MINKKLLRATAFFTLACFEKLDLKEELGWVGWDNSHWKETYKKRIKDLMQFELTQNNLVNIANYCNFLWNMEGGDKD